MNCKFHMEYVDDSPTPFLVPADTNFQLDVMKECFQKHDGFVVASSIFNDEHCVVVYHKQLYDHPPLGPTSHYRYIIWPLCSACPSSGS